MPLLPRIEAAMDALGFATLESKQQGVPWICFRVRVLVEDFDLEGADVIRFPFPALGFIPIVTKLREGDCSRSMAQKLSEELNIRLKVDGAEPVQIAWTDSLSPSSIEYLRHLEFDRKVQRIWNSFRGVEDSVQEPLEAVLPM